MQLRPNKAIFLDRDGVLNQVVVRGGIPRSPRDLGELSIVEDAREALLALKAAGYLLVVATNQPEVARGIQKRSRIDSMHQRLLELLPLDDIRVCFHDDHHKCSCRKPEPGLLTDAASHWDVDLRRSYMIGDRDKDLQAGIRAGCRTVLVRQDYNLDCRTNADECVDSLREAAQRILCAETRPVVSPAARQKATLG